jgi:hypothetical protein
MKRKDLSPIIVIGVKKFGGSLSVFDIENKRVELWMYAGDVLDRLCIDK